MCWSLPGTGIHEALPTEKAVLTSICDDDIRVHPHRIENVVWMCVRPLANEDARKERLPQSEPRPFLPFPNQNDIVTPCIGEEEAKPQAVITAYETATKVVGTTRNPKVPCDYIIKRLHAPQ